MVEEGIWEVAQPRSGVEAVAVYIQPEPRPPPLPHVRSLLVVSDP